MYNIHGGLNYRSFCFALTHILWPTNIIRCGNGSTWLPDDLFPLTRHRHWLERGLIALLGSAYPGVSWYGRSWGGLVWEGITIVPRPLARVFMCYLRYKSMKTWTPVSILATFFSPTAGCPLGWLIFHFLFTMQAECCLKVVSWHTD